MKVLVITDVHLTASPPAGCRALYTDDVKSLLLEAREIAVRERVDVTIWCGDFWHTKRGTPHGLVRWAIELLQGWPGERLSIVGNHDITEEGLASVLKQPIGVLFEAGALHWLHEDEVRKYADGTRVQWSPANYTDIVDTDPANFGLVRADGIDFAVKVAHASLSPKPLIFQHVTYKQVPTDGMDVLLHGHIHSDVGHKLVNGCVFACYGSLGRVARSADNLNRSPRLLLMTLTKEHGVECTGVELSSAADTSALYHDIDRGPGELSTSMTDFARRVSTVLNMEQGSLDEVLAGLPVNGLNAEAKKKLVTYLQEAGL